VKEQETVKGAVPIIGLQGEIKLLVGLAAYGEAAGLYVDYGDFRGSLIEAEAGLRYMIRDMAYISAGWREIIVDIKDRDNEARVSLGGVTVGLGVRF
jgi:hypothetical protein